MSTSVDAELAAVLSNAPSRSRAQTSARAGRDTRRELLDRLHQTLGQTNAIYVSTPITTGPDFVRWWVENGRGLGRDSAAYNEELDFIIRTNTDAVRPLVAKVKNLSKRPVIDPTLLGPIPGWSQADYHTFWVEVIERFVNVLIFADGWNYSSGCSHEFAAANDHGLETFDARLKRLNRRDGEQLLRVAVAELERAGLDAAPQRSALASLERSTKSSPAVHHSNVGLARTHGLKDDRLDRLAERGNVAQFVSFDPDALIRHSRMVEGGRTEARNPERSNEARNPERSIEALLRRSNTGSVNVRSFRPDVDKGCPFTYGLRSVADAAALVRKLGSEGFFTIVNETVNVNDGGVSGVCLGGALEFAPDDTPRAVETDGTAGLPFDLGMRLLRTVYGFDADLPNISSERLEFSVHPGLVGYKGTHTLWWESEHVNVAELPIAISWPNRFSRLLGDKAYGLLIAELLGLPVPQTTVISRRVAPFAFGAPTRTGVVWLRTCPVEQVPGRYTTSSHWVDPFVLLAKEDPNGDSIASIVAQQGVNAQWSGATLPYQCGGSDFVQGVAGSGDAFMLGEQPPEDLPDEIKLSVQKVSDHARSILGPVRLEWVHDGTTAWIVQIHLAKAFYAGDEVISPGDAADWLDFRVSNGLEALRPLVDQAVGSGAGIRIHGQVGLTSHVGDLLRRAHVPGRLVRNG